MFLHVSCSLVGLHMVSTFLLKISFNVPTNLKPNPLPFRYSIGRSDADNGIQYSWLWKLANVTQSPYSYVWSNDSGTPELTNGPDKKTMYVTALYFTMTCMTSVGFGNVAAETDNEKIFTICMMIIAGISFSITIFLICFFPTCF